eukprot:scaffold106393_cov21-Tisochrysis_lutea.AAC.2
MVLQHTGLELVVPALWSFLGQPVYTSGGTNGSLHARSSAHWLGTGSPSPLTVPEPACPHKRWNEWVVAQDFQHTGFKLVVQVLWFFASMTEMDG